ncbi:FMN-binding protein [Micromonospora sp. WMMD754]|uniref:FMN-binding protein n=1 Tax=unclassified Micromonospora TaxID=2617518 RepID=UPI001561D2A9|nr:FMN-binding protein [Micromonospora sp. WMMA2032]
MRRITVWLLSTVAALVLLFSYRTSTMGAGGETGAVATGGATTDSGGSGTATGSVAQTRWGPVQVRITVSAGKITDVAAVQVPDGNHRDQEINDYAVPILRQEALAAQSARIDTVSGATVTSDGYRESLQSAIDAAHLR